MSLKPLRLLIVGRLHTAFWKAAAEYYITRIRYWRNIKETIVKDANPLLPIPQRISMEGKDILKKLEAIDIPICLDTKGDLMTSNQFAVFLEQISENSMYRPCFIIGGAFGLSKSVYESSNYSFSLGKITLPHELARIVFFEQLYRAETLLHNIPYHH